MGSSSDPSNPLTFRNSWTDIFGIPLTDVAPQGATQSRSGTTERDKALEFKRLTSVAYGDDPERDSPYMAQARVAARQRLAQMAADAARRTGGASNGYGSITPFTPTPLQQVQNLLGEGAQWIAQAGRSAVAPLAAVIEDRFYHRPSAVAEIMAPRNAPSIAYSEGAMPGDLGFDPNRIVVNPGAAFGLGVAQGVAAVDEKPRSDSRKVRVRVPVAAIFGVELRECKGVDAARRDEHESEEEDGDW